MIDDFVKTMIRAFQMSMEPIDAEESQIALEAINGIPYIGLAMETLTTMVRHIGRMLNLNKCSD